VGPDRFDDVEYRVLEEPEPPRRPRLRRWTLTALSAVLATGAFAAGASAITGSQEAAPAAKASQKGDADRFYPRDYRDCDKPHGTRSSELKY
jgi:hypothetical protein